jgi:hypothetical protein
MVLGLLSSNMQCGRHQAKQLVMIVISWSPSEAHSRLVRFPDPDPFPRHVKGQVGSQTVLTISGILRRSRVSCQSRCGPGLTLVNCCLEKWISVPGRHDRRILPHSATPTASHLGSGDAKQ